MLSCHPHCLWSVLQCACVCVWCVCVCVCACVCVCMLRQIGSNKIILILIWWNWFIFSQPLSSINVSIKFCTKSQETKTVGLQMASKMVKLGNCIFLISRNRLSDVVCNNRTNCTSKKILFVERVLFVNVEHNVWSKAVVNLHWVVICMHHYWYNNVDAFKHLQHSYSCSCYVNVQVPCKWCNINIFSSSIKHRWFLSVCLVEDA